MLLLKSHHKPYARSIEDLRFENRIRCADGKERSEIYICRGEDSGKKLDRRAISKISIALGHNREDTAISQDTAMAIVGVGYIINVIQDSFETAMNVWMP